MRVNRLPFRWCIALLALWPWPGEAAAQSQAPAIESVAFFGFPASGDTYGYGESIGLRVRFDRDVAVTGAPRLTLDVGGSPREAALFAVEHRRDLYFGYTVQGADRDPGGAAVPAGDLDPAGGGITLAGSPATAAILAHGAVPDDEQRKVDGREVGPPRVGRILIRNAPASGDTYGAGETIWFQAYFDRIVEVTRQPRLKLDVGGEARHAAYNNLFDGRWMIFGYTVRPGDLDGDGIGVPAGALDPAGGTITLAGVPSVGAVLTHAAVPDDDGHKVDAAQAAAPEIDELAIRSSPAAGGTYGAGETIRVRVHFDRAVEVTGEPLLSLSIGGNSRQAAYEQAFFQQWLYFRYVVQPADRDGDGVGIPAGSLDLAGGSIALAGVPATAAAPAHAALAGGAGHKVDGGRIAPPAIRDVTPVGFPASGNTYRLGESIRVRVRFSAAVEVTGAPLLSLTVGEARREAAFESLRLGGAQMFFEYRVQAGDRDADGLGIPADALDPAGGAITHIHSSTTAAELTHAAVPDALGHRIDGSPPPTPPGPGGGGGGGGGRNRAPEAVGTLADRRLEAGGGPLPVEVAAAFRDPDGDALAYAASSSAPAVVAASVAGSTVTLLPAGEGEARVTVTATDTAGSNRSAEQAFTVTVACAYTAAPPHRDVLWTAAAGQVAVRTGPGCAWTASSGSAFLTVTSGAAGAGSGTATYAVAANAGGPRTGVLTVAGQRVTLFQASPTVFADHPIEPGATPVRAIHFLELRARIDTLRAGERLPAFRWTDPALVPGVTPVKAVHVTELRAALAAAYVAAERPAPAYAGPAPASGAAIRAAHLTGLRAAVEALE